MPKTNSFRAFAEKIRDVSTNLMPGKITVDNTKNPASAWSMMQRKTASMGHPANFPKQPKQFQSNTLGNKSGYPNTPKGAGQKAQDAITNFTKNPNGFKVGGKLVPWRNDVQKNMTP